jgi:G3E family GTPase
MAIFTAVGAISAGKDARRARLAAKTTQGELTALENSRQTIVNPYEGVKDLSSMITDVSGMASNPYANLGVATQAAEMQIEEADIALANTLDTIRATGSGAGGATALAQAALQSKKGVAASIEQQEVNNEQLRAQGEANLQNIKMSEAQRVQQALMGEQGRLQQADVSGAEFMYREQENREMQQLNRKSAILSGQQQQQMAAKQNQASAFAGGAQAIGLVGGALIGK